MTYLLDCNVLIALAVSDHVHHSAAIEWWLAIGEPFATCPVTQGALLRLLVREGLSAAEAREVLDLLTGHARHSFWPDSLGYSEVDLSHVRSHAQVTDAYLAGLARHHHERIATFDRGLAKDAPAVVTLIPTG